MRARGLVVLLTLATAFATTTLGQGVRSRMRPSVRGTTVTQSQASDLTLTLTAVTTRPVQTWVRTAGTLGAAAKVVTAYLSGPDATLVKVGQRARVFPVESRSSMYQAFVVRTTPEGTRLKVDVELAATGRATTHYLVEIVTIRGEFLSVPNEAIIEEGDAQVVYLQTGEGQYEPRPVRTGIQGELYTQVLSGVGEGDQVVTFGSFFIDSEYKLKGTAQPGSSSR
jgi:multidrug efflux pump subunit AcrA (membrane-fusion protein)